MNIEIYYRPTCPYCIKALKLLDDKKLKYTKYDITDNDKLRREMITRSGGGFTVPQLFFDNRHIGGCSELYALNDKFWKQLMK